MTVKQYVTERNLMLEPLLEAAKYSENQLAQLQVIQYPDVFVNELAKELNESPSKIWLDLLTLENPNQIIEIANREEFANAVEEQVPFIYIPDATRSDNHSLVNSVLTEEDRLGFELGSRGTGNILEEAIYQISLWFSKESPEFKRIKSKLRRYYVKVHDDGGTILYEREQTY